jgi:hypothetical protein
MIVTASRTDREAVMVAIVLIADTLAVISRLAEHFE